MKQTVTVKETANLLGISEQGVRIGLQRGNFPFGYVVKSVDGDRLRYIIPRAKLDEYLGVKND